VARASGSVGGNLAGKSRKEVGGSKGETPAAVKLGEPSKNAHYIKLIVKIETHRPTGDPWGEKVGQAGHNRKTPEGDGRKVAAIPATS